MGWLKLKPSAEVQMIDIIRKRSEFIESMPRECINCGFSTDGLLAGIRQCKRFPPSHPDAERGSPWLFPLVNDRNGCAEFSPVLEVEYNRRAKLEDTTQ